MKDQAVIRIREFTRFYLPALGLLGNSYLGSEYSAAEARVLFEIYERDGCNAAHIARRMNLDKSYLSRIIRSHEKNGYVSRTASTTDLRCFELHLTQAGKARTETFIRLSNEEIGNMIEGLSEAQHEQLIQAMDTITALLGSAAKKNA